MRFRILKPLLAVALAATMAIGFFGCTTDEKDGEPKTDPDIYTVTLHPNGGQVEGGETFKYRKGNAVTLPTPTKQNADFEGWYATDNFTGIAVVRISETDSGDKEFWAKWNDNSPTTYTVTFNSMGGSPVSSVTVNAGGLLTEPQAPKYTGHVFAGWFTDNLCTLQYNFSTPVNSSFTLYAGWTDEQSPQPQTYTITLHPNGGVVDNTTLNYIQGQTVTLPIPTGNSGKTFDGWYANQACTGAKVTQILATDSGNKEFWAKWNDNTPQPQTYTVTLHPNGGVVPSETLTYTQGSTLTLPTPTGNSGKTFDGWYANQACTGAKVTQILATDSGNKEFWAKWTDNSVPSTSLDLALTGYEEGACAIFNSVSGANYEVSYKPADGASDYKKIDSQLIRPDGSKVRADILGLKAGNYYVKVNANALTEEKTVTVAAYDRSGYAHFNNTEGVGAYNDDGTLKSTAKVVYVTEATKNSVTIDGVPESKAKGIVQVLQYSKTLGVPLAVRVIGTISAATWKEINYDKGGNFSDGKDYDGNNKLPIDKVVGKDKQPLPRQTMNQEDLINGGYNELDTSVYSELKNLSSKMNYSSNEYDSCWNNCSVSEAKNVTLEGVGADARLFQWGLTWSKSSSIEVRNLTFEDYTEDACSFEGADDATTLEGFKTKNIWVHHNTFLEGKNYWDVCPEQDKHEGDGATDFKKNAYITLSYNHYFENHKTGLIGGGDSQHTACVTFHHNYYESCNSRLPLGRQANMHMYNNYYKGSTGTNMSIRAGGYAFIENCYFENANNPITTQSGDSKKGIVKVYLCEFSGKQVSSDYKDKTVFIVTDRTKVVANDNIYTTNNTKNCFDVDSTIFYYDSTAKKTITEVEMLTAAQVKEQIPDMAGVHK